MQMAWQQPRKEELEFAAHRRCLFHRQCVLRGGQAGGAASCEGLICSHVTRVCGLKIMLLSGQMHADTRIRSLQDASREKPRFLLGIKSAEYSGTFVVNPHPTEDFVKAPPGLHIVVPTTGGLLLYH